MVLLGYLGRIHTTMDFSVRLAYVALGVSGLGCGVDSFYALYLKAPMYG